MPRAEVHYALRDGGVACGSVYPARVSTPDWHNVNCGACFVAWLQLLDLDGQPIQAREPFWLVLLAALGVTLLTLLVLAGLAAGLAATGALG